MGDAKILETRPSFLRQVISHLHVNVVRWDQPRPRPTLVDNLREFVGYIDTPSILPAIFKPFREFLTGIVIKNVYVQFALAGETGLREIAAAKVPYRGVDRVRPKQHVELGMERMSEKKFDNDLFRLDLYLTTCADPASSTLLGAPIANWSLNSFRQAFL